MRSTNKFYLKPSGAGSVFARIGEKDRLILANTRPEKDFNFVNFARQRVSLFA